MPYDSPTFFWFIIRLLWPSPCQAQRRLDCDQILQPAHPWGQAHRPRVLSVVSGAELGNEGIEMSNPELDAAAKFDAMVKRINLLEDLVIRLASHIESLESVTYVESKGLSEVIKHYNAKCRDI